VWGSSTVGLRRVREHTPVRHMGRARAGCTGRAVEPTLLHRCHTPHTLSVTPAHRLTGVVQEGYPGCCGFTHPATRSASRV
jgi:hypothetical protein